MNDWVHVLSTNLAVAGALCASFASGEYFERDTAAGGWRLDQRWAPNAKGRRSPWLDR